MRYLIITILIIINSQNSFACECAKVSLKEEIRQATEIFQGTVKKVEKTINGVLYEFEIEKLWKGKLEQAKKIETGFGGGDCGIVLEKGKSYVIFSNLGKTNRCRRNAEINETYDDLKLEYSFNEELKKNSFITKEYELNNFESKYLNEQFDDKLGFDFNGKKIAFTRNKTVVSKKQWYKINYSHDKPVVELIELSSEEKNDLNIDAILVTWSKGKISKRQRRRIIKQLKKTTE